MGTLASNGWPGSTCDRGRGRRLLVRRVVVVVLRHRVLGLRSSRLSPCRGWPAGCRLLLLLLLLLSRGENGRGEAATSASPGTLLSPAPAATSKPSEGLGHEAGRGGVSLAAAAGAVCRVSRRHHSRLRGGGIWRRVSLIICFSSAALLVRPMLALAFMSRVGCWW